MAERLFQFTVPARVPHADCEGWTRRDSNSHLELRWIACCHLHHGPTAAGDGRPAEGQFHVQEKREKEDKHATARNARCYRNASKQLRRFPLLPLVNRYSPAA